MRNYVVAGLLLGATALGVGLSGCAADSYAQKEGKRWRVNPKAAQLKHFAEIPMGAGGALESAVADIDSDGDNDLVYLAKKPDEDVVSVYYSLNEKREDPRVLPKPEHVGDIPYGGGSASLNIADVNNDEKPDVIVGANVPGTDTARFYHIYNKGRTRDRVLFRQ